MTARGFARGEGEIEAEKMELGAAEPAGQGERGDAAIESELATPRR